MKKLSKVLEGVNGIIRLSPRLSLEKNFIKGIETDSRKLKDGYLFVALDGLHRRGADFAFDAIVHRNAAAAIIPMSSADAIKDFPTELSDRCIIVQDSALALATATKNFYNNPTSDITLVGVTGTNGKTTVTYLLEAIFLAHFNNKTRRSSADAGKVGVIGTINYRYGGKIFQTNNTTPFPHELMRIFSDMKRNGTVAVAMEVSSHSLAQHRVDGCEFDACIFTNLTREHLDYHKTMENYYAAKRRLFTELLEKSPKKNKFHIVNIDDEWGLKLAKEKIDSSRLLTYSTNLSKAQTDTRVISYKMSLEGMKITCEILGNKCELETRLMGRYNISNVLAAATAACSLGIPISDIKKGLFSVRRIPGRLETVSLKKRKPFTVVVDYAHTPDALEKVIGALRELKPIRLITVFGCGGDRDRTKRPIMGEVAVKLSDYVIITSDNPRTEDPHKILLDIEIGVKKIGAENYKIVSDRRKAIETAINMASVGDIVLLAGKGHEEYQIIGQEKIHFSDYEEAKRFMSEKKHTD